MSIAFIYKEKDLKYIKNLNDVSVIIMDPSLSKNLKKKNIKFFEKIELVDTNTIHSIIDKAALNIPKEWIKHISESENFKQLITYKSIPLWLINDLGLELYLQKILEEIEIVLQIIKKLKPEEIYVSKSEDFPENVVAQIAKDNGIKVNYLGKRKLNIGKYAKYIKAKYFKNFIYSHPFLERVKQLGYLSNKKNVLIIAYTHLDHLTFKPLIKPLQEKYNLTVLALARDVQKRFSKLKIPFKTFGDYKIKTNKKQTREILSSIKKAKTCLFDDVNFKEKLVYKNIHLFDIIKDELNYTFRKHFPEIIYYLNCFESIMKHENIDFVLTGADTLRIGKTAVKAADELGIPSLQVQQGATGEGDFGKLGYVPVFSTKIAAWGKKTKQFLMNHKVPKEKIVIVGCPKFDFLQKKDEFILKEQVFRDLNLNLSKKLLVYATQNLIPEQREIFTMIHETLKIFPNLQLVVKLHPGDNEEFYQNLAKEMGWEKINCIKDYDLYSLLNACDILAAKSSTVALEALIMGKPVITINITNQPEMLSYASSGAALGVYKNKDMEIAIKKILSNKIQKHIKARNKFIESYTYKTDGKSTERVLNLVDSMLKAK